MDSISEMIARIKNAFQVRKNEVIVPFSNLKEEIVKVLHQEGFLEGYKKIQKKKKEFLVISLKYKNNSPAISEIRRVSKPGRRIYAGKKEIPKFNKGFGLLIISSPKGIITDKKAKKIGIGGEIICHLY